MSRALPIFVVLWLLVPHHAVAESVAVPPFTFQVPAGWTNLSPGAPEENFRGLPPAIVEQARRHAATAIDLAGVGDGFAENLNVVLSPCPGRFTERLVQQLARQASRSVPAQYPGSVFRLRESGAVQIAGVSGARLVFDMTLGQLKMRQLQYHLPGGERCAIVTYSSTPEAFARYLPLFEAAARGTTGLAEPPASGWLARIGRSALRGALIGGVAGGLAVLILGLIRRRRKRAP